MMPAARHLATTLVSEIANYPALTSFQGGQSMPSTRGHKMVAKRGGAELGAEPIGMRPLRFTVFV